MVSDSIEMVEAELGGGRARFVLRRYEFILLGALASLFIVVGAINPTFLSSDNLTSLFAGNAYIAIAAIGMSMIIICGHIDVSVGALIGVLAMVSGYLAVNGYPPWLAWLIPVVLGILISACVGALVAYAHIPSIVVTLGMLSILKGGLITVTGGMWLSGLPENFLLAQFRFLDVPSTVWLMLILTSLAALWMRHAFLGRSFLCRGIEC